MLKPINSYSIVDALKVSNGSVVTCDKDGFLIATVISSWDQIGQIQINTKLGWIDMCGEQAYGNDGSCRTCIELHVAKGFEFKITWSSGGGSAYLFHD